MKTKYFLIGFLLLASVAFSAVNVCAVDENYSIQVKKDEEYVAEIKTFNEDLAKDTFGTDDLEDFLGDGAELNAKKKRVIIDVEEEGDEWVIKYDEWDWTTKEFKEKADESEKTIVPEDPNDVGDKIWVLTFGLLIVPADVATYLAGVDWHKDVEVEGTTIRQEMDKDDIRMIIGLGDAKEDAVLVKKFASNGIMDSYIWETVDGAIVLDLGFPAVPGYELPILLGITAVFTIGLIYVIKKRV